MHPKSHPTSTGFELELTYCRQGKPAFLSIHSCSLAATDDQGFSLRIDGRDYDRVLSARIAPATAIMPCPAGFCETALTFPLMTCMAI